jgi:galactoside O-acetyltransferase
MICRNRIELGNDVTIAWNVTIYDHDSHSSDWRDRARAVRLFYDEYGKSDCFNHIDWRNVRSAPILIKDRVWIGFGATVLKGVTVGEGAIVAAHSVVTHDVEPYSVVAGNPARIVRRLVVQQS